jgi:hypothetical protein
MVPILEAEASLMDSEGIGGMAATAFRIFTALCLWNRRVNPLAAGFPNLLHIGAMLIQFSHIVVWYEIYITN